MTALHAFFDICFNICSIHVWFDLKFVPIKFIQFCFGVITIAPLFIVAAFACVIDDVAAKF